jgi:hypothetical protein
MGCKHIMHACNIAGSLACLANASTGVHVTPSLTSCLLLQVWLAAQQLHRHLHPHLRGGHRAVPLQQAAATSAATSRAFTISSRHSAATSHTTYTTTWPTSTVNSLGISSISCLHSPAITNSFITTATWHSPATINTT